jgi:hypothetical protein
VIGRFAAVADLNWLRLSGWPAWLIWVFIHLLYIVEFQNRLLVALQWGWLYASYDRSARLITGKKSPSPRPVAQKHRGQRSPPRLCCPLLCRRAPVQPAAPESA